MSKIEVNTVAPQCGTTLTLGESGDTVTLGAGASQSGFGRTGTVDWQTGSIKTTTFTAANGEGYFANTSGGAFTMNLPAGSAGAIVSVVDYTNTFQTDNLTVSPNGSEKIGGVAEDATLSTEGQSVTFVYVDGTEGWKNIQDSTSNVTGASFICASVSGSCNAIVTSGNFKTAVFKGPGNFTVNSVGACASDNVVDYIVVAGGGSGGSGRGGGGGGGGFRMFSSAPGSNDPKNHTTGITVTAQTYPIVVGGGGGAKPMGTAVVGAGGNNSSGLGITSTGGGGGGTGPGGTGVAGTGGSGGGGNFYLVPTAGGAGNTPPVSPPQGSNGAAGGPASVPCAQRSAGAGGGAGATGGSQPGGAGGAGGFIADPFIGPTAPSYGTGGPTSSTRYFAGGGGAGMQCGSGGAASPGGGGGAGGGTSPGTNGTINTGGGGGGVGETSPTISGGGGSGIVMIRYKFQ